MMSIKYNKITSVFITKLKYAYENKQKTLFTILWKDGNFKVKS